MTYFAPLSHWQPTPARTALALALLATAACHDAATTAPRALRARNASADVSTAYVMADFTIVPGTVVSGQIANGTVTLGAPAPAGGVTVAITGTNDAVASAPRSVVVGAGLTSATFDIHTGPVPYGIGVQFAADVGAERRTAGLIVQPAPPLPSISVSPSSLAFGSQPVGTTSAAQVVTVRNSGSVPLTLGALGIGAPYTQSTDCPIGPATLAAGASCSILVSFAPTSAGAQSGSLTIPSDAPTSPSVVQLNGTGFVSTPALSVTPTTIGFGSVALGTATSGRVVKITSNGNAPLVISSAVLGGANPGDFAVWADGCTGASLLPGASCTLSVSFEPLRIGSRTATLTIAHNAAGGSSVVSLGGTGARAVGPTP